MSALEFAREKREERMRIAKEMTDLATLAADEKRDFTPEELTKFDNLEEACKNCESTFTRMETAEQKLAETDEVAENRERKQWFDKKAQDVDHSIPTTDDYDLAFRGWMLYGTTYFTEEMATAIRKVGADVNLREMNFEQPTLFKRMSEPATDPDGLNRRNYASLRRYAQDLITTRATTAQTITTTGGGNLIANEAMAAFQVALIAGGAMRQAATIVQTDTGATKQYPGLAYTDKGNILAINTAAINQDLSFTQQTLGATKYTSNIVTLPMELIQDANFDVAGWVGSNLGQRISRITEEHYATGAASVTGEPEGLVTTGSSGGASVGATASSEVNITHVDLVKNEHYVDPVYRQQSQYMFHDTVLSNLRQQLDGNSRPLWQPSLTSDVPDRINNYPYFVNQEYGSHTGSSASTTKVLTFGPHQHYVVRDVVGRTQGFSMELLRERYAEFAQVAFVGFSRHQGQYIHPTAGTTTASIRYMAAATS